jgi:hypothetical protein
MFWATRLIVTGWPLAVVVVVVEVVVVVVGLVVVFVTGAVVLVVVVVEVVVVVVGLVVFVTGGVVLVVVVVAVVAAVVVVVEDEEQAVTTASDNKTASMTRYLAKELILSFFICSPFFHYYLIKLLSLRSVDDKSSIHDVRVYIAFKKVGACRGRCGEMVGSSRRTGNRITDKNRFCLSSSQSLIHREIMWDARIFIVEVNGDIRSRRYRNSRFVERDILR